MAKKKKLRTKSKSQTKSKPVVTALAIPDLPPSTLSGQDEAFCVEFVITQSQCRAAVASGRSPNSGWLLYQREDIRKRIAEITPEVMKSLQSYHVAQHVVSIGRVLMNFEHIATIEKPDEKLGFRDQIRTGEDLLEMAKLLQPRSRGGVNVSAQAQAGAIVHGQTMKESYRPIWLMQKEAKIAAELEAEERATRELTS